MGAGGGTSQWGPGTTGQGSSSGSASIIPSNTFWQSGVDMSTPVHPVVTPLLGLLEQFLSVYVYNTPDSTVESRQS